MTRLFDMDGTLVDSTAGVVGAWEKFAQTYPGLDVTNILSSQLCPTCSTGISPFNESITGSHGVRAVENLAKYCNITDPAKLEVVLEFDIILVLFLLATKDEAARFDQAIIDSSRADGRKGIAALPGVRPIINELHPAKGFPHPRWAICTSATRAYASAALDIVGIDIPDVLITAEDVNKGKPSPDPYLLGASQCGVEPSRCLVIEDAPAGIRSGLAAGCKVVGLLTTHSRQQMEESQPHLLVPDMSSVTVKLHEDGVDVSIQLGVNGVRPGSLSPYN
ncbi:HAD-like domain-containing protein [Pisolithus marmoratus]|nr:HAD-like domain-containing protein [Pisolithus marmoratus]